MTYERELPVKKFFGPAKGGGGRRISGAVKKSVSIRTTPPPSKSKPPKPDARCGVFDCKKRDGEKRSFGFWSYFLGTVECERSLGYGYEGGTRGGGEEEGMEGKR